MLGGYELVKILEIIYTTYHKPNGLYYFGGLKDVKTHTV